MKRSGRGLLVSGMQIHTKTWDGATGGFDIVFRICPFSFPFFLVHDLASFRNSSPRFEEITSFIIGPPGNAQIWPEKMLNDGRCPQNKQKIKRILYASPKNYDSNVDIMPR